MTSYLATLAKEIRKAQDLDFLGSDAGELACKKIIGTLTPGKKCAWAYLDDVAQWQVIGTPYPTPEHWPYTGFIIPVPETNGRNVMEEENVIVVITDYPIEKENPVTDWATLVSILKREDLFQFRIL